MRKRLFVNTPTMTKHTYFYHKFVPTQPISLYSCFFSDLTCKHNKKGILLFRMMGTWNKTRKKSFYV